MKNSTDFAGICFSRPGQACDDNRGLEIEIAQGCRLPHSYRATLKDTRCGIVDRSNSFISFSDSQRDNEHMRMALDTVLAGIGGFTEA